MSLSKLPFLSRSSVSYLRSPELDSVPLIDIVKEIEKIKNQVKPTIIYTHHRNDLNIDHRIVYTAVLTACRPMAHETVKEIYSFEVPSSTEWNYPITFSPNLYLDISKGIDKKIKAMGVYESEKREFPHPRSAEALMSLAKTRGREVGLQYAEAYELIRKIK